MRLLVLNYEYPPLGGGAAPVCKQLCEFYAKRGHEVEVVTMAFRGLPKKEEHGPLRITRVPALRKRQATCETPEMLSYVLSALPRVIWRLWRKRFDAIHVHFVIPTGLLAFLATRFSRTPYVITAHGSDIPGYNPDRFNAEHCVTKPLLRLIMRKAAALTAPSLYLKDLMHQACGPFDIAHIPNGIDVSRFTPRPKQKRILMTGRLLPRKGFQWVLEALQGIDTDWEVHIAGDGPMREELEAMAANAGAKVVFHGWIEQDDPLLRELYETSAIFCLPSERENASISLLEAMSAGMAVVTSNVSGCPETVGDAGFVVPPRDSEALRQILQELVSNPEPCREYGAKARRRAEAVFSWDKVAENYLELLQRAATGRRGAP